MYITKQYQTYIHVADELYRNSVKHPVYLPLQKSTQLPSPRPCLASCSKAARYAARAKPWCPTQNGLVSWRENLRETMVFCPSNRGSPGMARTAVTNTWWWDATPAGKHTLLWLCLQEIYMDLLINTSQLLLASWGKYGKMIFEPTVKNIAKRKPTNYALLANLRSPGLSWFVPPWMARLKMQNVYKKEYKK